MKDEGTLKLKGDLDIKHLWNTFVSKYLIITGIVILVIYTAAKEPAFYSYSNISSLLKQMVPLGLVSVGMTLIIIGGYIDLSVAGMFSFLSMISAITLNSIGAGSIFVTILVGALCGGANAAILIWCGAKDDSDSLFITFGMSTVFTALALLSNSGLIVKINDSGLSDALGRGTVARIPIMMFIYLIVSVIVHFLMKKTPTGRGIHLAGGNPQAASLCGISNQKVISIIFIVTGIMTALGAFIMTCRVGTASPTIGKNFETNAIMSVTIGGTSLQGGHGSVLNTIIGVLLVTVMANALNILGIDQNMQNVWKGVILVVAIWLDAKREY